MLVTKEIKIVIPIWQFIKSGGMRVLSCLGNCFQAKGIKVVYVAYYKTSVPYFPIECEIQYVDENGDPVERVDACIKTNWFKIHTTRDNYARYCALLKALNRLAPEYNVVIANANLTAYPVAKSKIKNKFYYIQLYEACNTKKITGAFWNALARRTYKMDMIQIVNSTLYTDYKEISAKYVVPLGINLKQYYPKKEYWDGVRPLVIGCIGRLEVWKGSEDAAKAVEILQEKGVNVKFKVAFNPVQSSEYELVVPDGDDNLAEFYRSLDVLLAPGRIQLGAVHYPVLEAMACGTSVITTGYYPADESNAYIVPVEAPDKIADAVMEIMNKYDAALRKIENGLQRLKEFDWDVVSDGMLNVIFENLK